MLPSKLIKQQWTLLVLLAFGTCIGSADDSEPDEDLEQPFPAPLELTSGRLHIISEQFDPRGGYLTREEYVDLSAGKATFIQTKSDTRETFHMDADTQTSFYFSPYYCWSYDFPAKPSMMGAPSGFLLSEQWAATKDSAPGSQAKKMYLTGVAAIWLNAKSLPKTYSKGTSIYSASKDVYQAGHMWQARMGDTKASFHFHEVKKSDESDHDDDSLFLTLETIELETGGEKTTINVLSYEFDIEESVYQKELQLPLSYGCYKIGPATEEMTNLIRQSESSRFDDILRLEAVATKRSGQSRHTDTISLEFLRTPSTIASTGDKPSQVLQLLRQRNSRMDFKTVLNHVLNVEYQIDMQKGTCAMMNAGDAFPAEENRMTVSFSNGLELKLNKHLLDVLFFGEHNYQFTKSVDDNGGIRHVYMTMPVSNLFDDRVVSARIVRKYSIKERYLVNLESATIWILDNGPINSNIDEIYHFTILERSAFTSAAQIARAFDISEECYLDGNEARAMRYGRDYAWLELHYSVAPPYSQNLPYETFTVKQMFYENMRTLARIGYFRIPRLEMLFDEVGFTLRLLMLDSPPLHLIYDKTDDKAIEPAKGEIKQQTMEYFEEIAPDLRHCSELCRLNRCARFSFCANSYSCILAHSSVGPSSNSTTIRYVPKKGCTLFEMPAKFEFVVYNEAKLHHFIGQLQRHDLGSLQLPRMPEELTMDRSEIGLSAEKESQLRLDYAQEVRKFLGEGVLSSVSFVSDPLIGIPDRFEVEQDPLAEFHLDGNDELQPEDETEAPAFHEGLSQYRFNHRAFEKDDLRDSKGDQRNDQADKREARRYVGIDYEQCALACVDGKCSSFSYCKQRQECTITNIWDLGANSTDYIQADTDCVIAQRDFLSKFHKLPQVKRPEQPAGEAAGRLVATALNPSECAHGCVVKSDFNCLAFTYCQDETKNPGTCYYSESRTLSPSQVRDHKVAPKNSETTNCDHYSRSYLADFARIEYRELQPEALNQLKTSLVEGQSVDRCAELCASQLMDCTAFQFCYDPEAQQAGETRQRCTMIESPPKDRQEGYRVVLGEDGTVLEAGKLFLGNQNCHVFSLKKGSSEAELRQLALNPLSKTERGERGDSLSKSGGLSLGGGLFLFFSLTLVFSAMGFVFVIVQRRSAWLRGRIEHLRVLSGRYY